MNRNITFYYEWIKEDKKEFRILAMIAEQKGFNGSLADICRYFSLSPQSKNKNNIKESIEKLSESRFITVKHSGNSWELEIIPQDTEIQVDHSIYKKLLAHDYEKTVAWEAVIKVLMWLTNSKGEKHTDREIAAAINYSEDTVGDAKAVLENDCKLIIRHVSRRWDGEHWVRVGQRIDVKAWLDE